MELTVPEADPAAVARMKFEAANHVEPGRVHKLTDFLRRNPDVSDAAKSGTPTMDPPKRDIPATVPQVAADIPGFSGDVTVAPLTGTSALDTQPDARSNLTPAADARGCLRHDAGGKKEESQATRAGAPPMAQAFSDASRNEEQ